MAANIPLPGFVYQDLLEERLLLKAFAERWHDQTARALAPALTMASRNDLVLTALQQLQPPHKTAFIGYRDALTEALPAATDYSFPAFMATRAPTTSAERLAVEILVNGQGHL